MNQLQVVAIVVLTVARTVELYRPVVLVHGLFGNNETWMNTTKYLNNEYPNINITISHKYEGIASIINNMWDQVNGVYKELREVLTAPGEGVTLICYSQGGLVCRGLLETYSDLNVHTFITLSAPLAGQYGLSSELKTYLKFLNVSFLHDVHRFVYTPFFQKTVSIANYWNDPLHQGEYLKECIFLPKLNNFTQDNINNFLKIKQLVMIGGKDDKVITPWQSSQLGFYAENSETNILDYYQTKIYQDNTFGLKTLHSMNKINTCTINGVGHHEWPQLTNVFEKCIKKWIM